MLKKIVGALVALVVIAAAVLFFKLQQVDSESLSLDAAARVHAPGRFVELSDGITHYDEGGSESRQTVVLVHGFSVPYYIWDTTYGALLAAGFHVVRYDSFGRGFSDRPNTSYDGELFSRQLVDLVRELGLRTPVDVIGLSMGGAVVARFTAENPELVRRVVLIDPTHKSYDSPSLPKFIGEPLMAIQRFPTMAEGQMSDFLYPENYPEWVDKYRVQMQYKGFRNAITSTIYDFLPEDHLANYAKIQTDGKRVKLIWGVQDQTLDISGATEIQSVLDADFMPVDDAGHLPHMEQAELVNPAIVEFLRAE